jgi:hypothetical protein
LNKLLKIALAVLAFGIIGSAITPFLFTRKGFISFVQTDQIGDTIGGITAPITSLVGSVLVFLALWAQIIANKVTQRQIREQKMEEQTTKEVIYVSELYQHFTTSIQNYETKYYRGHRAIAKVMNLLAKRERKNAHEESYLYYGTAAELYGILKFGKLFFDQVNKSRIDAHDRTNFKELVKYHYDSFILPYLTKNNADPKCEICGELHNGIPFKMSKIIQETVVLF